MADIALPDGYTGRAVERTEISEAAEFLRSVSLDETGRPGWTAHDLANLWAKDVDIERDTMIVHERAGSMAALEFVFHPPPYVTAHSIGGVAPGHTGRGLGSALVEWAAARARERSNLAPVGARILQSMWIGADHAPSVALTRGLGLAHVRDFFEMRILFEDARLPAATIPDEVVIRSFRLGADEEPAALAQHEAFRDHFGAADRDPSLTLDDIRSLIDHADFDPTLWWVAEADGRVVGVNWAFPSSEGDETLGYIDTLGVIAPWRGRGIARAMLLVAFHELASRGKRGAELGVDGESLTGATRLYEDTGMRRVARTGRYERPVRAGEDVRKTSR